MDVDNQPIEVGASGDPRYSYGARPRPDSDIGMRQDNADELEMFVVERTLTTETQYQHHNTDELLITEDGNLFAGTSAQFIHEEDYEEEENKGEE